MTTSVTVRGARIRYRQSGDPAGSPVVLLHGIGRSLEDWDPQHERLADGHRVISADLAGFGLSDPLPGRVSLGSLAEGVRETLDALGEQRPAHVMGNSLGGAVAMELLARHPRRVATLTLVNSAGFGQQVTVALRLLTVPLLGRLMLSRATPATVRLVERSIFADPAFLTEQRLAHSLAVAAHPGLSPVYRQTAKVLGSVLGVRRRWRADLLARVAAEPRPTLIGWGDRDLILPVSHLAAARAAFPHARSHLFIGAGHMPQIERADDFAALARALIDAAPAPADHPPRSG